MIAHKQKKQLIVNTVHEKKKIFIFVKAGDFFYLFLFCLKVTHKKHFQCAVIVFSRKRKKKRRKKRMLQKKEELH